VTEVQDILVPIQKQTYNITNIVTRDPCVLNSTVPTMTTFPAAKEAASTTGARIHLKNARIPLI
jgi:hypothetical protein